MKHVILVIVLASRLTGVAHGFSRGGANSTADSSPPPLKRWATHPAPGLADLDAHQAVREGNRLLIEGNPTAALSAYQHAEQIEPDAREIAFVTGLAHYELEEFDRAREAFQKAAALASDSLADNASYSSGVCDHAQALQSADNPELALSLLESAMRRYHDVLASRPDHRFARDANLKAATMWRELKQQLQEQQQQQDSDQNKDDRDQSTEDQQQQPDENREQENRRDQPQEQAEDQPQQQQQQQQQKSELDRQEQVSREQAERKLREMVQAIRERKKARRKPVQKVPVTPVDKDW